MLNQKVSFKEVLEKEAREEERKINRAMRQYEVYRDTEVVEICKNFLRGMKSMNNNGYSSKELEKDIKRTEKVIMSYYETGNPELPYQQCKNMINKLK